MNLKQYLIIMLLGTVFCWISWVFVIINIDPFQDSGIGFTFFYFSLLLALIGTISVISFLLRNSFSKKNLPMFRHIQKSFKDSLIISSLIVLMLFLQGQNYLNSWNVIIFLFAILLGVIFLWSSKNNNENLNLK
ncbi:MAG TPA: hypothetical protein PK831_01475 [Candidatus Magasanikbacteria bacterium]|jgi:hypothetical protein|nr:hypothetical protein [Candidatus Magasanikbacteria bacterium]HQF57155.1 hypothetical protein [Candidatus Magasanikbacteria bacterium]HQL52517.1 hypothetical protein [Candidatus Magasanikbacteria bacterium]